LILLDIMMPGIDGYEVCRRLKADEATRAIPVIFVTTLGEVDDETKGLELGAVDYITKPISAPIVQARVKTHLMLARQREQLAQQNAELIEAARLKEDVDRIMRHDLRSPLTSIVSIPRMILEDGGLNEDQTEFVEMIEEAGYRLLNMVNLSLSLFKMERGTYTYEPASVDLLGLARKTAREFQDLTRTKRLGLRFLLNGAEATDTDTAIALGEEVLCYSMLANLLKNALEAAPHEDTVSVRFERGDALRVAIHNQGVVPEAIRDTFFDQYATAGKSGGTGLGTYSARLIAETQGGSVAFETSEVDGTTVTVTLRLPADDDGASGDEVEDGSDPPGGWGDAPPPARVLVVDDDVNSRRLLCRHLEHPALRLHSAATGTEAVEKCAEVDFDVVLMDVEMPGLNGAEAAARIRANAPDGGRPKLVALSAHEDEETRQACFDAGVDAYLVKPVSREQLQSSLATIVRGGPPPEQVGERDGDCVVIDADIRELVPGFLHDKRVAIDDLRSTLDPDNLESARALCHQLKGTAHMYGFVRLSDLVAEAEASVACGDVVALTARLTEVANYLRRVQVRYKEQ
jgi:two-component system sensor histidine kinase/response regulator